MAPISINGSEFGLVRVFSLSLDPAEARRLAKTARAEDLAALLGAGVDPAGVEVLRIADLEGFGLRGYLSEGVDIEPRQLDRDAAKLAALDGWVMLVYSSAFGGTAAELYPAPVLTLIGTYGRSRPAPPQEPLSSAAAAPRVSAVSSCPEHARPSPSTW